jgi:hypothetical protein
LIAEKKTEFRIASVLLSALQAIGFGINEHRQKLEKQNHITHLSIICMPFHSYF